MNPPNPIDQAMGKLYEAVEILLEAERGRHPIQMAKALDDLSSMARAESRDLVLSAVRFERYTWTHIGHVFGISRQAAAKRFG